MNEEILKKKAEGIINREASESNFEQEHREKALKEVHKAIKKGQVKRFQDLKNKSNAVLSKIAKENDIEFYN